MYVKELIDFIHKSPTPFHAVDEIKEQLTKKGFTELPENRPFEIHTGGKYYVIRNSSSIIAFTVGDLSENLFRITASHSDSPCFKIKENAEIRVKDKYVQLNTEGYGGMILAPWLDRPLSVAGRVFVRKGSELTEQHICFDRDLVLIPNMAIHMNRKVNEGYEYNKQIDMLPLLGGSECKEGDFKKLVALNARCSVNDIMGSDLFLYSRTPATVWGANNEYISASRLDDLECAYATLKGFIASTAISGINVYACFDNEEVGSQTGQGAASTFLYDVLKRICLSLGKTEEEYMCMISDSFMLSCDNAHAVHPSHPEKTDSTNYVYMNDGIVIKTNANQKYTSDAASIAKLRIILDDTKIPYQFFANRSDVAGGSTLGNIAMSQVSVKTIDIGLAQLAMHSPYETAGAKDVEYLVKAAAAFYAK